MTKIVVLFNLKNADATAEYEAWARATDLPTVNGLASVDAFTVHRSIGLLGSDGKPPYHYVEILDVNDMSTFGAEVSEKTMQKVAGEFQAFADNPIFILTEDL